MSNIISSSFQRAKALLTTSQPVRPNKRARVSVDSTPKRAKVPKAIRRLVWEQQFGEVYSSKCTTSWCRQTIDVWTFECAHDIPHSKGGLGTIENLVPMCSTCNSSMSNKYTLKQWNALSPTKNVVAVRKPPVLKDK